MEARKQMYAALRKQGFRRTDTGKDYCEYTKQIDERREVRVQFFSGPVLYRASHSHNGCSDTYPTEFKTLSQMQAAVDKESTRLDSKYAKKG